jgi:hypothetical protein
MIHAPSARMGGGCLSPSARRRRCVSMRKLPAAVLRDASGQNASNTSSLSRRCPGDRARNSKRCRTRVATGWSGEASLQLRQQVVQAVGHERRAQTGTQVDQQTWRLAFGRISDSSGTAFSEVSEGPPAPGQTVGTLALARGNGTLQLRATVFLLFQFLAEIGPLKSGWWILLARRRPCYRAIAAVPQKDPASFQPAGVEDTEKREKGNGALGVRCQNLTPGKCTAPTYRVTMARLAWAPGLRDDDRRLLERSARLAVYAVPGSDVPPARSLPGVL